MCTEKVPLPDKKRLFVMFGIAAMLLGGFPIYGLGPSNAEADLVLKSQDEYSLENEIITMQKNTVVQLSNPYRSETYKIKTMAVVATGYSSRPEETDDTPNTTASGRSVRNGIVANNYLPFGTKIRIPEIYGEKEFVVEDRMNQRCGSHHIDIWFSSTEDALNFGAKRTYIEIIEN